MTVNEEIMLHELVEDYIGIMQDCDEEKFKELWHPEARRFGLGNSLELGVMNKDEVIKFSINGLKNLKKQIPNPDIIKFNIDEIINIKCIKGVIASVELRWHMILPGAKGNHHTFIQFAKHEGMWYIVNVLDLGYEIEE